MAMTLPRRWSGTSDWSREFAGAFWMTKANPMAAVKNNESGELRGKEKARRRRGQEGRQGDEENDPPRGPVPRDVPDPSPQVVPAFPVRLRTVDERRIHQEKRSQDRVETHSVQEEGAGDAQGSPD